MITSFFIPGSGDYSEPMEIRREVFAEGQTPELGEKDMYDEAALHLVIYSDEIPAAAGRIWHDGRKFRIGCIAVRKQFRGQGLGDLALRLLLYKAFNSGAEEVTATVPEGVKQFYNTFGFGESGEVFARGEERYTEMSVEKGNVKYPSKCGR